MEVSLLEAEGLPQGCLLSVSSGGVRRQAPATREKCRLAFPSTATRGEGIRIEALEVVAGAKLPLQAGVEKYNLDLKGGKGYPARVSLLVRDLALSSVGSDSSDLVKGLHPPTPRGSGSRRHLAALSARRYLEDKGLLQWVQGLFQELVRERPEDPWPYVDRHSRELFELGGEETEGALDEEAPRSSPEEATAPEEWVPGARAPEEAPELEAPLPSANRAGTGQLKDMTAANIEAAISGAPPRVLHELLLKLSAQPPSADEATTASDGAKEELRVLLAKACQDGSLHNALHTAMGVEPQAGALTPQAPRTPTEGKRSWRKAPGRVSPPVSVASLPKAGEGEASSSSQAADSRRSAPALSSGLSGLDLEQLRQKARRRIEAASLSRPGSQHRLERSPSEIDETQEPSKQAGKAEEDAPSLSINELRAKAYLELTAAVQEQRLTPEALGFGPPSMGQLKERALSELVAAAQDGSLDAEILELTAHQGEFASSSSGRRSIKVLQPPLVAQEEDCTPRGTRKPLEAWAPGSLAGPGGRRPLEVTSPPPLAPSTEEEDDDDEQVLELRPLR